jgi:serine protease Do
METPPPRKRSSTRRLTWLLLVLLAALGLFTETLRLPIAAPGAPHPYPPGTAAVPQAPPPTRATGRLLDVYQSARRATVRIESRCSGHAFDSSPIDIGSGFFVSPEGRLLTAYHVVRRQALSGRSRCLLEYVAVDWQQREYPLELVGFDAYLDLALLQARVREPVPFLSLTGTPPKVGSRVLAIGNSRGEFLADRVGAITRLGVRAGRPDFASGTIELTAALAPGDSGGPVIGEDGEALGVVSYISFQPAILSAEGDVSPWRFLGNGNVPEFASYAVPALEGSEVVSALESGGRRDTPVIGFEVAFEYDPRDGRGQPLGRRAGVVVGRVQAGGPGAAAGLRSMRESVRLNGGGRSPGAGTAGRISADVIVAVDGKATPTFERLLEAVREKSVGDRVILSVQRGEKSAQLSLELAAYREVFY